MNHKKSMRIFWLSLCLLLVSGALIIAAVQFHAHKKAEKEQDAVQENVKAQTDAVNKPTTIVEARPNETDTITDAFVQQTNGEAAIYLYELKIRNGYVEVYYYHTERLFLYTGIPYHMLTMEQRLDLQKGKYFQNEQDLYGYLESCTS